MTTMLMRVIIIYIKMDTILPKMRRTGVYLYSLHRFFFVGHVDDGGGDHHLHHHCHIFKVSPPFFVRTCCTRPPQPSQHGALGAFGFLKSRSHLLIKIIIIHWTITLLVLTDMICKKTLPFDTICKRNLNRSSLTRSPCPTHGTALRASQEGLWVRTFYQRSRWFR